MSERPWLDAREARAWRGFVQMQTELRARTNRQLQREAGLSEADYAVLVGLSEAPDGRLRAFELGRQVGWEKSRLSHHLSRMEQRGLVRRERCLSDSRGAEVVLTAHEPLTRPPHPATSQCGSFVDGSPLSSFDAWRIADVAGTGRRTNVPRCRHRAEDRNRSRSFRADPARARS
jgi:DNA-binding MarR family transcriptional regulator